jgi:hypothetical protein
MPVLYIPVSTSLIKNLLLHAISIIFYGVNSLAAMVVLPNHSSENTKKYYINFYLSLFGFFLHALAFLLQNQIVNNITIWYFLFWFLISYPQSFLLFRLVYKKISEFYGTL